MKKKINLTLIIKKTVFLFFFMKILNLYYIPTGNTEKIARKISSALKKNGYDFAYKKASA